MNVYVSVVEPGKGLITGGMYGTVIRLDKKRWYVDIVESDTVDLDTLDNAECVSEWRQRTGETVRDMYVRGAAELAALHTDGPYSITVEYEYGPTAWQPETFERPAAA